MLRDNVHLGYTATPQWHDETVSPSSNASYSVIAYDQHGNIATTAAVLAVTTLAATQPDERRVGLRSNGAYWGSAGEQVDLLSGNLNFSVPLFKAVGRGGWGVTFALSYNSQLWRSNGPADDQRAWLLGGDTGYPAANDGRISKSKDWVAGEEVNYTYDSLNRLTLAETTGWGSGTRTATTDSGICWGRR